MSHSSRHGKKPWWAILFEKKAINYIFVAILGLLIWKVANVVIFSGLEKFYEEGLSTFVIKLIKIITFFLTFSYIFLAWKVSIEPQMEGNILFLKHPTPIWLHSGYYFLPGNDFNLFSIYASEIQSEEMKDVKVPEFNLQDNKGKTLTAMADGDYKIGDTDDLRSNYRRMIDAGGVNMVKENLSALIKRTLIKLCGSKDYWSDIIGNHDLAGAVVSDTAFQSKCAEWGVTFDREGLVVEVVSADMKTDNESAQRKKIKKEIDDLYEDTISPAHKADLVEAELGKLRRIHVGGTGHTLGRYDMDHD